jgi:uncharacterized protein
MIDVKEVSSKKQALIERLKTVDSLLVAFSGGVDSTFLLALARQVLGEKVVACTATSIVYPSRESKEAMSFAKEKGADHVIMATDAMSLPDFTANKPDRCYHCKKYLFEKLKELAAQKGIKHIAHAANLDDLKDYRPGWRAAEEMGILAPLVDARLTKEEIRFLSREIGLASWNKPSMACLASRIPFGESITEKKLRMIQEAEGFIAGLGFTQYRVRYHGPVARIEVEPEDIHRLIDKEMRMKIVDRLKDLGFLHVSVDLEGYVSGSTNRGLEAVKVEKQ